MGNDSKTGDRLSRRKMLALTLSGTAAGIAGCTGGGGNDTTTSGGGGESTDEPADTDAASEATTTAGATGTTGMSSSGTDEPAGTTGTAGNESGGNESGGNGSDAPGTVSMSPDQMADATIDQNVSFLPGDANWNHYSNGPMSSFFPFDYTSNIYWNGNVDWWLLKEDGYSYDSDTKTATYEFREDYAYWWSGDPVTAKDYMIQQEIKRLQDPEGSAWKSWTLTDEYTLKGKRKQKVNPILLGVGSDRVFDYREVFTQWYEKLKDATTQDARDTVTQKLNDWSVSTEEFVDKGMANGTYKLTDWNTTEVTWEKFEDHPFADQVPVPTIKWHVGSGSAKNQQITQDTLDFEFGKFPQELRSASPDYLETLYEKRSIQVRNLLFNYNRKHIGRRNVRRALMAILDFTQLVDFWNGEGGPVKQRQTGLPKALEDEWLGEELVGKMYDYPLKSDKETADKFMKKAGYSKEGGTWKDSDGDPLKFTFMIGSFGTMAALGKAITRTWKQWGAKPELSPLTNAQWNGKIFEPTGDWDVTIFLHGWDRLDALNYYDTVNPYHMRLGPTFSQIEGWLADGKTHSPVNGKPLKLTIPSEPGALEVGDDGGEEINIYELVEELKVAQDKSRSQEIIRTLARYFNYDLPMFDMFPQVAATWGDTRDFSYPDDTDVWYQKASRAGYNTLRKGLMQPVSKDE